MHPEPHTCTERVGALPARGVPGERGGGRRGGRCPAGAAQLWIPASAYTWKFSARRSHMEQTFAAAPGSIGTAGPKPGLRLRRAAPRPHEPPEAGSVPRGGGMRCGASVSLKRLMQATPPPRTFWGTDSSCEPPVRGGVLPAPMGAASPAPHPVLVGVSSAAGRGGGQQGAPRSVGVSGGGVPSPVRRVLNPPEEFLWRPRQT